MSILIFLYITLGDPGVLLYSVGTSISYFRISESSLTQNQLQGTNRSLVSSGASALGNVEHFNYYQFYSNVINSC